MKKLLLSLTTIGLALPGPLLAEVDGWTEKQLREVTISAMTGFTYWDIKCVNDDSSLTPSGKEKRITNIFSGVGINKVAYQKYMNFERYPFTRYFVMVYAANARKLGRRCPYLNPSQKVRLFKTSFDHLTSGNPESLK